MNRQTPVKSPKKKDNWVKRWLFILLFFVILTPILYFTVWKIPGDPSEADKMREEAEARLEKSMNIPADKNAWNLYRKAVVELSTSQEAQHEKDTSSSGGSSGTDEHFKRFKEENENILKNADSAFALDDFQYPVDFDKIRQEEDVLELQFTRKLAEFLIVVGDMERNAGNNKEALNRYLQVLHLGHGLGRNSYLICGAYSMSIQSIAIQRLNSILNGPLQDADFYKSIIQQMERIDNTPLDYKNLLKTEIILGHYSFRLIRSGSLGGRNLITGSDFYMNREKQIFNNYYTHAIKAMNSEYPEACSALEKQTFSLPALSMLNSKTIPVFLTGYRQFTRYQVQYGGIIILAALKEYRVEKGEYPEKLSALVPEYLNKLPVDLFSPDGNYSYEKSGDKILLYSIGNDLKDNKGKFRAKRTDNEGDVIFAGK